MQRSTNNYGQNGVAFFVAEKGGEVRGYVSGGPSNEGVATGTVQLSASR